MLQQDVVEVNRALAPCLSVVRQYLGEILCNSSASLADASACLLAKNKSGIADDLTAESQDTSVTPLGECMHSFSICSNLIPLQTFSQKLC